VSAAQPIGDYDFHVSPYFSSAYAAEEPLRFTCQALSDPEDPPPGYRAETYPMHENETEGDLSPPCAATLAPPTDSAPPLAERETLPPESEEGVKASVVSSTMSPPPNTLAAALEAFALEARAGRAEIMTELRSVGREVAGIRHEATRTNQRMTGLEEAFSELRVDTRAELHRVKKQLRRALRRIAALEELELSRKAMPSVPATSPTEAG
jgi:hypothetical protein